MWLLIRNLASPKKFFYFSNQILPPFTILFLILFTYGLIGGLFLAPPDYLQGEGFRIIYVHAPCAFLSLFIYGAMTIAAVSALVFRLKLAFMLIKHSAPLGAGFTFLALLTGSLWGKPMWGTWWIWDARLTSELLLLFIYLSIILFQKAVADKSSGERASAMLVLVGSVDLPIIHYSVYWWNTLHQGATLKLFAPPTIASPMLYPLLAMIAALLLYYIVVLLLRMRHDVIANFSNHHWLQEKK